MDITVKDIALKAKVAVSTVSRALNDKSDISPKTREKILKIINECGYQPNSVARGLVMQKYFTLGLIIPDISNPFFAEIALNIEKRAKESGYSVLFINTDNDLQNEIDSLKLMQSKMVDGLIASLSTESLSEYKLPKKFPVVLFDRKVQTPGFPGVFIDHKKSAYNATKYLIELGHRRIAHFTGNLNIQTACDRMEGFKNAVKDFNLNDKDIQIEEGEYTTDSGKEVMRKILKRGNIPTAIFAASDLQAAGILYVASKAGIKVPSQLSILGHDDIDLSYLVNPTITTMEQPKKQIGKLAVEMLLEIINNTRPNKRKQPENSISENDFIYDKEIILDTNMVIRESTAKFI